MAARKAKDLLIDHAAVLVVVADTGETYALDPYGIRASEVERKQPGWMVGTYATGADRGRIVEDLGARAAELKAVAA